MTGLRQRASVILGRSGFIAAAGILRRRLSSGITILGYHRVLDVPDEEAFAYDIELVSASVAAFAEQMRFLRDHHHPMTFSEVLSRLDRGAPIPKGACIVTLDDGYSDNFHNAFPILKSLGMPATIFLSTGYIDRQETFWYEQLTYAVLGTTETEAVARHLPAVALGKTRAERREALDTLLRRLKHMVDAERRTALADLLARLKPAQVAEAGSSTPLTWDQIREMSAHGIEFGSHTVDHPILSQVSPEQLHFELRHSKARIEAMTGKPVLALAYPDGGHGMFDAQVQRETRAAGYRLGISTIQGVDSPARWDPFSLRRLQVERYVDMARFRASLVAPSLLG